jgi:hypothetical protein
MEALLGESEMSKLLGEYGFGGISNAESRSTCDSATALAMYSGLGIGIGSPTAGLIIARAQKDSKKFWPTAWSEDRVVPVIMVKSPTPYMMAASPTTRDEGYVMEARTGPDY